MRQWKVLVGHLYSGLPNLVLTMWYLTNLMTDKDRLKRNKPHNYFHSIPKEQRSYTTASARVSQFYFDLLILLPLMCSLSSLLVTAYNNQRSREVTPLCDSAGLPNFSAIAGYSCLKKLVFRDLAAQQPVRGGPTVIALAQLLERLGPSVRPGLPEPACPQICEAPNRFHIYHNNKQPLSYP